MMKNYKYLLIMSFLVLLVFNTACSKEVEIKKDPIGVVLPAGYERILIKKLDYGTVVLGKNGAQHTAVIVNSLNTSSAQYDWDNNNDEGFIFKFFGSEKVKVLIIIFNDSELLSRANKIVISDNKLIHSSFINKEASYDIIDLSNMDLDNFVNFSITLYDTNENRIYYWRGYT